MSMTGDGIEILTQSNKNPLRLNCRPCYRDSHAQFLLCMCILHISMQIYLHHAYLINT
jgi:hypothetical protein